MLLLRFSAMLAIAFLFSTFPSFGEELVKEEKKFPIRFATHPDQRRAYSDVPIENIQAIVHADAFSLELHCDHPEAVGAVSLYFHSRNGWYHYRFDSPSPLAESPGLFRLQVARDRFNADDGEPGPWEQIDLARITVWRGGEKNATATLKNLSTFFYPTLTLVPDGRPDQEKVRKLIQAMAKSGIGTGILRERELTETGLVGRSLVVLPNNPSLSEKTGTLLKACIERGGKLIAFQSLSNDLAKELGMDATFHEVPAKQNEMNQIETFRFNPNSSRGGIFPAPACFSGRPVNLVSMDAHASMSQTSDVAYWYDRDGQTKYPALIVGERGAFMTFVPSTEEWEECEPFFKSLFACYSEAIAEKLIVAAWSNLMNVGDPRHRSSMEFAAIRERVLKELDVRGFALDSTHFGDSGIKQSLTSDAMQRVLLLNSLHDIHEMEIRRYCESKSPRSPEFRAWWEHDGTGPYPGNWDRTMKELSANGFNAVITNMLWGGSAAYASDILPRNAKFEQYGDQIDQAIQAGKRHGVEVHVWKVHFKIYPTTKEFVQTMRKEGRLQKSRDEIESEWLCPSHPKNVDLECDSLCEVVRKYDVDGIHYDYIRYPNLKYCFCEGCRDRFAADAGVAINHWPNDVSEGGAFRKQYSRWRCDNINQLVERLHREVKSIRPSTKISAAVVTEYPIVLETVAQDWRHWAERKYVDFLCPMNYMNNLDLFEAWTKQQIELSGNVPIYPGIGLRSSRSSLSADRLVAQIEIARALGAKGYVIFNLNSKTISRFPAMAHLGVTKKAEEGTVPSP